MWKRVSVEYTLGQKTFYTKVKGRFIYLEKNSVIFFYDLKIKSTLSTCYVIVHGSVVVKAYLMGNFDWKCVSYIRISRIYLQGVWSWTLNTALMMSYGMTSVRPLSPYVLWHLPHKTMYTLCRGTSLGSI